MGFLSGSAVNTTNGYGRNSCVCDGSSAPAPAPAGTANTLSNSKTSSSCFGVLQKNVTSYTRAWRTMLNFTCITQYKLCPGKASLIFFQVDVGVKAAVLFPRVWNWGKEGRVGLFHVLVGHLSSIGITRAMAVSGDDYCFKATPG